MAIVNATNLDAVSTAFDSEAQKILANGVPGIWRMFTEFKEAQGKSVTQVVYDGIPKPREWIGPKVFKQLTKYELQKPIRPWEVSMRIPVDDVNQDPTGAVNDRLGGFRRLVSSFYDEIMMDELLANPTGYDEVALLSASHARLGGLAAQDNITTSALSYAELENAQQYFGTVTDGNGRTLGLAGTHLIVGPAQATLARQLTASDQLVGISDSGEIVAPGGSGIDGVGTMQNYIGGSLTVVVTPHITGNQWFVMDLSRGKPMFAGEFQSPELTIKDRPEDDNIFFKDEILMSITAKMTPMARNWQTIYGSVTA